MLLSQDCGFNFSFLLAQVNVTLLTDWSTGCLDHSKTIDFQSKESCRYNKKINLSINLQTFGLICMNASSIVWLCGSQVKYFDWSVTITNNDNCRNKWQYCLRQFSIYKNYYIIIGLWEFARSKTETHFVKNT